MKTALAFLLIALVVVLGAALGAGTTPPSADAFSPRVHVAQHAAMTSRMAAGGPAQPMETDPMWRMMRDPAHIRAEELYQQDLDRMLGRTSK